MISSSGLLAVGGEPRCDEKYFCHSLRRLVGVFPFKQPDLGVVLPVISFMVAHAKPLCILWEADWMVAIFNP